MRNNFVQMTLEDIYNNITLSLENKNSNPVSFLEEHINLDELNLFKDSFALADNKNFKSVSLKADIFLSRIIQLIGVILADKLHKPQFIKSIRKLIA